jgi:quercetin dioxygenase-like cupin family protein
MELSERFIKKLEEEGFDPVYEWQDAPNAVHQEHSHQETHAIIVTDGSITIETNGQKKELTPGQRIDIPAEQKHTAGAGSEGAIYIIGEKSV